MRVLMTTDVVGGVWTFTQELVSGLLELGCDVALLSLGRSPSSEQRAWSLKMEERWGSSFYFRSAETALEWMQNNERSFTKVAPLLLRMADEFAPEVLHCNQFCFGALPISIPKVVTAHSDVLSWASCCRNGPFEDSKWLDKYRSLVQTGLSEADAVIAPTQWMLRALDSNFDLSEKQLVISNGRSLGSLPQSQRKLQSVSAGRLWDEGKNIAMLSDVRSFRPILVAGEFSCKQADAPTISGRAKLLGVLSQKALLALFNESAVYICTSQYEPFGLAPLEAALCGCAVLANDIPPLREVWGDAALYFSGADKLSELLDLLYADPDMLASAQARSYERAQRYTREAVASAYLTLFTELTARKRELSYVA